MAAKRLSMRKIREILRLKHEVGFTHRSIAQALHVAVGTVSEYLAKAKKRGLSWPLPEELSDSKLEARLFPPPPSSRERVRADFAYIHEELKRHRGLTLLQLWVEYAEDNPGAYRYSRYCELYGRWKKKLNPTMRQRHRAGEKTFVDFSGKKPHIVDPKTGELRLEVHVLQTCRIAEFRSPQSSRKLTLFALGPLGIDHEPHAFLKAQLFVLARAQLGFERGHHAEQLHGVHFFRRFVSQHRNSPPS